MKAMIKFWIEFVWMIFAIGSSLIVHVLLQNWFPGNISPAGSLVMIFGGTFLYILLLVFLTTWIKQGLRKFVQSV